MRRSVWLAVVLVLILPLVFFMASCTKKAVQSDPLEVTEPEVQEEPEVQAEPEPEVVEPEVQAEPEQVAQTEDDQLWKEVAAREAADKAFVTENIHFAFDSSSLSEQARRILSSKAEYLRTYPDVKVTIEGHCDERGTEIYNMALGKRRAESVKVFLSKLGIGSERLNTVSYGEDQPIAMGQNEASWATNRRAEFVIN